MGYESAGYGDKLGNRYEGRWVVRQMLFVLGGRLRTITLETVGDDEHGVDLWVESNDGTRDGQQCKGEHGTKSQWSMADLNSKGILEHLRFQLNRNGKHRFTLVSSVHARSLLDLSRRARDSTGSAVEFYEHQVSSNQEVKKEFHAFCRYLALNPSQTADLESAYLLLQRADFHQFAGDAQDQLFLEELAAHYVDGKPSTLVSVLADFASANPRKTLTADDIIRHLDSEGFQLRDLARDNRTAARIGELRNIFRDTFTGQLAGGVLVSRSYASDVLAKLEGNTRSPIVVVHGRAGFGKSGVLLELTSLLEERGIPYLPFRLDRQPPTGSPRHFGEMWNLPDSPAICLSQLVGEKAGVLILDQLDAMRWTSGHASDPWLTCQAMIRQAKRLGNVRVVVACRTYDLDNDPQFTAWAKTNDLEKVEVGDLDESTVRRLVGDDYDTLNVRQRNLLKSVQNVTMWLQLSSMKPQLTGIVSATDLMRKFWDSRYEELGRRNVPPEDVHQLIDTLIDHFNRCGTLSAPYRLVQRYQRAAQELQSLNVIRVAQHTVTFCHQSYSDYLLVVRLADDIKSRAMTVFAWLGDKSQQSLFRREQLRLLLSLMRDEDLAWYIGTLRSLLDSDRIRFHLKHLCLQVLGQGDSPTDDEVELALRLVDDIKWRDHVTSQVFWRNAAWMRHGDVKRKLHAWLSSGDDGLINHTLWLLRSVDTTCGDLVAELIEPFENEEDGNWQARLDWIFVRSPHEDSDRLFDIRLRRVARCRSFDYVDWEKLARATPDRCLPLLAARLKGFLYELENTSDEQGQASSTHRPRSVFEVSKAEEMEVLRQRAEDDPDYVWENIVPLVEQLLASSRQQVRRTLSNLSYVPRRRRHHGYRLFRPLHSLIVAAGQVLVRRDFDAFSSALSRLSGVRSRFAQRIVSVCFLFGADDVADQALQWLIEKPGRLQLGNRQSPNRFGPARRLIKRFAQLCSDQVYCELERVLLDCHPQDEWKSIFRRHQHIKCGWCQDYGQPNLYGMANYFLLTALPRNRMSRSARAACGVAREKFSHLFPGYFDRRCRSTGGLVRSPIPPDRLHLVSDGVWLDIIKRYTGRREADRDWKQIDDDTVAESSVETFSRDLGVIAKRQPRRFVRLALKIPKDTSPCYLSEIMRALEATSPPEDATDQESVAWETVLASEIEAVFKHARHHGHPGLEHSLCTIVRNRPDAGWSDWILDEVCRLATSHPDPKPRELVFVKDWEDRTVEDLETTAINYVRGPAAQAIRSLLFHDAGLLDRCRPAIEALIADPHPGVRIAATGICLAAWNVDRGLAVDWFLKICECDDDRILPSHIAVRFVNYAQEGFLNRLKPTITRMVNSEVDEVKEHGAARTTFIWLHSGELADLFAKCLSGSASHRKGVAMIVAHNVTDAKCGMKSREVLMQLLDDSEQQVREQALAVFRCDDVLECKDVEPLVTHYVSSKAFQDDPTEMLHSLDDYKGSLIPYRHTLFAICDALSGELATDSRSIATRIGHEADRIPTLLLRLYEQAQGKGLIDVQDRCLDTWDRLLESRVGTTRGLIEKIDV